EEKAARAESEKDAKKKPYEADPLFVYLWSRGYGTSAYRAGRLARFFDRKIAALIDYEPLRQNYFMLNEIPLRLREHASRLADAISDSDGALALYERKALEQSGIDALERKLAEAEKELQRIETRVDEKEA